MPSPPPSLPPELGDGVAFTVRRGQELGLTSSQLRGASMVSPAWGARAAREPRGMVEHLRVLHTVLPDDVAFSHLTAARLLGLPTPRPWHPAEPAHVMRPTGTPLVVRRGCEPHRGLERRATRTAHGIPVVGAIDTWVDLAPTLALDDLVAVGDMVLARGVDNASLQWAVRRASGRRGVRMLREAMVLVRPGSRSAWESKARVLFVGAGLPEPELNADIVTADGRWLSCSDFVWREQRVVGEYDGDQHRTDRRAWQYERERRAGLEADDWTYVEMTSLTLTSAVPCRRLLARLTRLLL